MNYTKYVVLMLSLLISSKIFADGQWYVEPNKWQAAAGAGHWDIGKLEETFGKSYLNLNKLEIPAGNKYSNPDAWVSELGAGYLAISDLPMYSANHLDVGQLHTGLNLAGSFDTAVAAMAAAVEFCPKCACGSPGSVRPPAPKPEPETNPRPTVGPCK